MADPAPWRPGRAAGHRVDRAARRRANLAPGTPRRLPVRRSRTLSLANHRGDPRRAPQPLDHRRVRGAGPSRPRARPPRQPVAARLGRALCRWPGREGLGELLLALPPDGSLGAPSDTGLPVAGGRVFRTPRSIVSCPLPSSGHSRRYRPDGVHLPADRLRAAAESSNGSARCSTPHPRSRTSGR